MKTYAVYMNPKGSIASQIGSDTLFGALCWAIRMLSGAETLKTILCAFNEHPKFVVSSAFPYLYRHGQKVRFFPKPLLPGLSSVQLNRLVSGSREVKRASQNSLQRKRPLVEVLEKEKKIMSAAYVSDRLFEEIVAGKTTVETLLSRLVHRGVGEQDVERVGDALITKGERMLIDPDGERQSFWSEIDIQRNEIDRLIGSTVEGRLFFVKEVLFVRDIAGLWFILCTDDLDCMKPLLRYMQDTGIGGDRTVGKGHFSIPLDEIREIELPDAGEAANCFIALSRYMPTKEEHIFDQRPLSYALSTIRPKHESKLARISQRIYKKMLRLFEPGSILPIKTVKRNGFYGQIVPVGTNAEETGWEVWQNGMAVPAFAKIRGEEWIPEKSE